MILANFSIFQLFLLFFRSSICTYMYFVSNTLCVPFSPFVFCGILFFFVPFFLVLYSPVLISVFVFFLFVYTLLFFFIPSIFLFSYFPPFVLLYFVLIFLIPLVIMFSHCTLSTFSTFFYTVSSISFIFVFVFYNFFSPVSLVSCRQFFFSFHLMSYSIPCEVCVSTQTRSLLPGISYSARW